MSTLSDLQALIGPNHVSADGDLVTVAPATTEELSAVLRYCSEQKLAVTPTGNGTKLGWGNPVATPVRLVANRLSGVREHVWQDMTATVGAGTIWADMQAVFAPHGQRVALDPLFPSHATVGGTLAANESGALRARYGSLRDLVLGATVVLADGTIARSGGKVVKNVAGYDLPKLMIGSFGTLAVITEVNVRLHPVEQAAQTWTVQAQPAPLGKLLQQLREAATTLQSLQLRSDGQRISLDVRFASSEAAMEADAMKVSALVPELTLIEAGETVWDWREHLFRDPNAAVLKVTCLPSQVVPIVEGFSKCGVATRCAAEAHGIITAQLVGEPELIIAIVDDLRARLRTAGGLISVLQWPFRDMPIDPWGGSPPAIAVMRELKQQFDPQRLLNPGKFVGGI